MMDKTKQIANRAFQLESHLLDQEFLQTINSHVDGLEIPRFGHELKLLLRLYLFANYVKANATTGMQVYNMNYCDIKQDGKESIRIRKYKLALLAACNLAGPYIMRRYQIIDQIIGRVSPKRLDFPWLTLDNLSMAYKSLNLFNFLLFLRQGRFLTLEERLFGLAPVISDQDYSTGVAMNKVQMDFLYRETIWSGLADFLTTIIPMINVDQVKNEVLRSLGLKPIMQNELSLADKIQLDANKCALCGKQPFNPFIIGCRHVFCYYCISAKYMSDPGQGYACLACNYSTKDQSNVRRYRISGPTSIK